MIHRLSGRNGCITRLGPIQILHDHITGSIAVSFPWTHHSVTIWPGLG